MKNKKFEIDRWKYIFSDLKLVKFVTKVEVMDGLNIIAKLDNDHNIIIVYYDKIKKEYGNQALEDILKITSDYGRTHKTEDIVYVRCDELEIATHSLWSMARRLEDLYITDRAKTVYAALLRKYTIYGQRIDYLGYEFHIVKEEDIY